jgi:hypothetical protein
MLVVRASCTSGKGITPHDNSCGAHVCPLAHMRMRANGHTCAPQELSFGVIPLPKIRYAHTMTVPMCANGHAAEA